MTVTTNTLHPAAQWAIETGFNAEQVDCTTTVVLKILDNKCKMSPGEMAAVMAIYDALRDTPAPLFDNAVHEAIKNMRLHSGTETQEAIHRYRIQAEAAIPKPIMKRYKAFLHDGLFG
jgi:hypothetical protein